MECIFCDVVNKKAKSKLLLETDRLMVVYDIYPKAPIHVLIIPKSHLITVNDIQQDSDLGIEIFNTIKQVVLKLKIDTGYQVHINNGERAGQVVSHLHIHIMGGWEVKQSF